MPIDTGFSFAHQVARPPGLAPSDLLGLLRDFSGNLPASKAQRSWKGTGFNLIWRPNFGNETGNKDFFLQLNLTAETLAFTDITGKGITNRGFLQKDVALGGVAYLQTVDDSFDGTGQHFEPGVWAHVPATDDPTEPETVVRMGLSQTRMRLRSRIVSHP